MKISLSSKISSTDILFIFLPKDKWDKKQFGNYISPELSKQIDLRFKQKDFEGGLGELLQIFQNIKGIKRIFLVGTGEGKKLIDMRKATGVAIRKAKKLKIDNVTFLLPEKYDIYRAISGAVLGNYEFKVGDKKDHFSPKTLTIITSQKFDNKEIDSEIYLAESTNIVRELVNLPANLMTPTILSQEAKKVAKGSNNIKVRVYGEKDLKKFGMQSFFSVGQGSDEESQLVVLEYYGGKKTDKPLALVGKGVCFDAGGYNLKPIQHIEDMKSDMAGAAAVIGIFDWIAKTKPNKNIIGVIGAVENLVSHKAFKPGDILTAMNGETIEITNTDAEGRLVLADCLYYTATKFKPELMIDIATLTGAAIVALGYEITAIMGNDDKLLTQIKKSAEFSDEDVWELPINDYFREKVKGFNADLLNWTPNISAGSSMGGAFLEQFVEEIKWAHIDIAGTAFHPSYGSEISPKGATGVMMRTLRQLIMNN